jgi:hypothetical protein
MVSRKNNHVPRLKPPGHVARTQQKAKVATGGQLPRRRNVVETDNHHNHDDDPAVITGQAENHHVVNAGLGKERSSSSEGDGPPKGTWSKKKAKRFENGWNVVGYNAVTTRYTIKWAGSDVLSQEPARHVHMTAAFARYWNN